MMSRFVPVTVLAAAVLVAASALAAAFCGAGTNTHFADATNRELVAAGRHLYAARCASCHGRSLQGQPLWQLVDRDTPRRAPAHDQTGHTWRHSDEDLFTITKYGRFPSTPAGAKSYMPAFGGSMDDHAVLAVIAFIKASWPVGLRVMQASLNPGRAGMPADALAAHWTFPPTCRTEEATNWAAARGK